MAKKFRAVVIILIGLGLTYWFLQSFDWAVVGNYLSHVRLWPLLLAAVCINLTMLARALRWQVLLSPIAPIKLDNAVAATAIGFGSLFVVGRAASEIIRPILLSLRENLKPSATFATIMIERIYDTTAVVLLFAVNLLFFTLPTEAGGQAEQLERVRLIGGLLLAGLLVGIVALILLRTKAPQLIAWLERLSARYSLRLLQPVVNLIRHLADGLSVLVSLRALALSLFYTGCVWVLVSTATGLVFYSFGQAVPLSHVLFVLGFGLIGSLVPTPGGSAGAFHATAAKGMIFLGFEPSRAAAMAIVYHLVAFGAPLLVGLFYLMRDGLRISQLRAMLAQEMTAETTARVENTNQS